MRDLKLARKEHTTVNMPKLVYVVNNIQKKFDLLS